MVKNLTCSGEQRVDINNYDKLSAYCQELELSYYDAQSTCSILQKKNNKLNKELKVLKKSVSKANTIKQDIERSEKYLASLHYLMNKLSVLVTGELKLELSDINRVLDGFSSSIHDSIYSFKSTVLFVIVYSKKYINLLSDKINDDESVRDIITKFTQFLCYSTSLLDKEADDCIIKEFESTYKLENFIELIEKASCYIK